LAHHSKFRKLALEYLPLYSFNIDTPRRQRSDPPTTAKQIRRHVAKLRAACERHEFHVPLAELFNVLALRLTIRVARGKQNVVMQEQVAGQLLQYISCTLFTHWFHCFPNNTVIPIHFKVINSLLNPHLAPEKSRASEICFHGDL
jgi:hypothetical protein